MNDNPAPPQLSAHAPARSYRIRYTSPSGTHTTYATGLARMQRLIKLYTDLGYPYKADII